jgi:hypothetical protein
MFGVSPVAFQTLDDGTSSASFQLATQATVLIKFVERPSADVGKYSVSWLEGYLNEKFSTRCWPVWGENHYGLDSRELDMDNLVVRSESAGYRYHLHKTATGRTSGHFADPTGWQIHIEGTFS